MCVREKETDMGLDLDLDGDMSDHLGIHDTLKWVRSIHSAQRRLMADQVPQLSQNCIPVFD